MSLVQLVSYSCSTLTFKNSPSAYMTVFKELILVASFSDITEMIEGFRKILDESMGASETIINALILKSSTQV